MNRIPAARPAAATPLALAAFTTLALAACAAAPRAELGRNLDVLTREEIAEANQMTALQVVEVERPQWLHRRGQRTVSGESDIVVYFDGARMGGPEALSHIPAINVERMRFYNEAEAQFRFGVGHLHGAIEVISRKD